MIAKTFLLLFVVGLTQASSLAGKDPNTMSCDPKGHVFLLLPHFTDCTRYYVCNHGNEVEMACPAGTVFDFFLQTCNHEWAVECILRDLIVDKSSEEDEGSLEGSGEGSFEGSGEGSGDLEWSSAFQSLSEAQPEGALVAMNAEVKQAAQTHSNFVAQLDCRNPTKAALQLPYKGDCQRYWRCFDGLPQTAYCSDGLFFNALTSQCDFENSVRCDINHDYELDGEFLKYQ